MNSTVETRCPSKTIMIKAENLKKDFSGNEVLKGIDLEVSSGEVIAVIGPSGSGKSTMLRCLIGLEKISGGSIYIDGNAFVKEGVYVNDKQARGCQKKCIHWSNFSCHFLCADAYERGNPYCNDNV